ncbi:MAG TPA: 16S rRNA (uracil(1498)-N(3))-methyltransferase [Thermoanaerobaculia bacterium]|nr:16S rRNA (uracil(1498)-N(3))-methyltransferase [Thermoanaerobaculia bacterium]
MRNRFYVQAPLPVGSEVELTGEELHHAARVLRVRSGEEVELFDGLGASVEGRVTRADRDHVTIGVTGVQGSIREGTIELELAMALIQLDKFELVLQKATELGVTRIIPLLTDRVEIREERARGKEERWQRILLEAVKQSGRTRLPALDALTSFHDALAANVRVVVFDGDKASQGDFTGSSAVRIFIGPEGGLSENELQRAEDAGAAFRRLGPRRLRAETAAIAALVDTGLAIGDLH